MVQIYNPKLRHGSARQIEKGYICTSHMIVSPQQQLLEIDNESVIVRRTPPLKQIIDKNRFSYVDYFSGGNEAKEIAVWSPESLAALQLPSVANFNGQIIKFLMRHQAKFIKEICTLRRCLKPFHSLYMGSHPPGTLSQVVVLQKFGLCWYFSWKNREKVSSSPKAEILSCSLCRAHSAL